MESQPPLAALCLLGVLGPLVKLNGSDSPCQGRVEVFLDGLWHTVDSRSWGRSQGRPWHPSEASQLCRKLSCREALLLGTVPYFSRPLNHLTCHGSLGSFSHCNASEARQRAPLSLICLEPLKTAPPPTRPLPTTTPEPTAPPRLRLVPGPGGLRCAGVVEFYSGRLGGTVAYEDQDSTEALGDLICEALQCGSFLKHLPEAEAAGTPAPGGRRPLPIRWKALNASCASLEQCFRRAQPWEAGRALALVCSDFQPQVQSRLVGGSGVCEGAVEVRQGQGRQWEALCHSPSAKGAARWAEVCREQQCGPVSSYRVLEAGEKASRGLVCPGEKLSQCHQLQERRAHCKRVFVTCQDPNPAGLGTGTVMSIVLALVLLAVLLVTCGPLAYKKLVKKFRQKKQRQWIGPTGLNQSMSFHRDPGTTVRRSQVENPAASRLENEYSQPPRGSQLSAYPALEGALHRVSAQPDNSSDSDYDLHGAQRL
ncbi:T-cell surface glycoprotein CD5 [Eptesicus fuscus]|uniref:T-cell surface glycoprotein CD5 n=1 Tax=Eptesicus fuscus TaxID=29078 RepID=UPI0024045C7E|nr:T-cell surface glycoprotein CD5 [Eptesicus fuscus]